MDGRTRRWRWKMKMLKSQNWRKWKGWIFFWKLYVGWSYFYMFYIRSILRQIDEMNLFNLQFRKFLQHSILFAIFLSRFLVAFSYYFPFSLAWPVENIDFSPSVSPLATFAFFPCRHREKNCSRKRDAWTHSMYVIHNFLEGKKYFFSSFLFFVLLCMLHIDISVCIYIVENSAYIWRYTLYSEGKDPIMMPYVIFCKCLFISENGHLAMKCFHSTRRSFDIIIHSLEHINVDSRGRKKSWWRDFSLI